jgi:hypothetical protein
MSTAKLRFIVAHALSLGSARVPMYIAGVLRRLPRLFCQGLFVFCCYVYFVGHVTVTVLFLFWLSLFLSAFSSFLTLYRRN